MTSQELKAKLTDENIKTLLLEMGATIYHEDKTVIITDTICHCGNKPKLYYYKDSKQFHCYTECGQLDIFDLVMHYKDFDKTEFYNVINWICVKLGISTFESGFGTSKLISDWEFIRKYKHSTPQEVKKEKVYDDKILKIFQDLYCEGWVNEGISIRTLKKYNIKYSVCQQKIIIPHYNKENQLIGIRTRAMLDNDVSLYGKYNPLRIGEMSYNHQLGNYLYGLNQNIKAIQRKQKIMLVEAEKSVLQTDTMFGDDNFTVALCGSNLTDRQVKLILELGVREVIIALDKQFTTINSEECVKWAKKIKEKIVNRLAPYVKVSILWDTKNLLHYKDSPTDRGKGVLLQLMQDKLYGETSN